MDKLKQITPKQVIVFQKPFLNIGKKDVERLHKKHQANYRRATLVFTPVVTADKFKIEVRISECHMDDAFVRTAGIKSAFEKAPRHVIEDVTASEYLDIVNAFVLLYDFQITRKNKIVKDLGDPAKRTELITELVSYTEHITRQLKLQEAMASGDLSALLPQGE